MKNSIQLPDFYNSNRNDAQFMSIEEVIAGGSIKKVDSAEQEKVDTITPKEAYNLRLLNDEAFEIKVDPVYVEQQLADFRDKLSLLDAQNYDMERGIKEIGSILVRFENRKKLYHHI